MIRHLVAFVTSQPHPFAPRFSGKPRCRICDKPLDHEIHRDSRP